MRRPELVLTSHFFKWLFYTHRKLYDVAFHIPNEGKRSPIVSKMIGIKSGVPDIFLAYPHNDYSGLFIELKIKPNKPTKNQIKVMNDLELCGYAVEVCYTLDETINVVTKYMGGEL